jgi:hypothetical protein
MITVMLEQRGSGKKGGETMKKTYIKPVLRRLGLLRQVTRFSFGPGPE